jgi:hypothetical protein
VLGGDAGDDVSSNISAGLGNLVVPDTTSLPLPGQLPGIPGGGASNGVTAATDSSGINGLYLSPLVNPTPTGGYMTAAAQVVASASGAFTTYVKGSPSVAIPPVQVPISTGLAGLFTTSTGATNWTVVGLVVVAGLLGILFIVHEG